MSSTGQCGAAGSGESGPSVLGGAHRGSGTAGGGRRRGRGRACHRPGPRLQPDRPVNSLTVAPPAGPPGAAWAPNRLATVRPWTSGTVTVAELADAGPERSVTAGEVVAGRARPHRAARRRARRVRGRRRRRRAGRGRRPIDERIAAGEDVGPLAGVPLAVKDLEDAAGYVTTQGSVAFAGDPPATVDSPLVERLRAAGCVVVGKTNTPELGWKPDTVNELFGATRNPWALEPLGRRFVRRVGGGGGRRPGAAGHRLGRRRLDPHPRGGDRPVRAQALARAGAERRRRAPGLAAAVDPGPDDAPGPRPGAGARRRGRPRADRPFLAAAARRLVVTLAGRAAPAAVGGLVADARLRAARQRGAGRVRGGGAHASRRRAPRWSWSTGSSRPTRSTTGWPWPARTACARSSTSPRTRCGVSIDPGLVAGMEWVAPLGHGPALRPAPSTPATRLNLALVELFHRVPLLLTPDRGGADPGDRRARHHRRRARRSTGSATRTRST